MKKIKLSILLSILMSMVGAKAYAYDIAVDNADGVTIYYNYINEGLELEVVANGSYSSDYKGNVVIPDEVTYMNRTRKVTSIGEKAFYECSGLTSVTIPNSVTKIGESTFKGCSGLTSVTVPNSVTKIDRYAFQDCSGLTSIEIPSSVTSIGVSAFEGTGWYNTQPDGMVYVGKVAYKYKGAMPANTNIIIKEGTLGIGDSALSRCNGLTSVTIPSSVTNIGDYAFMYCSGLASVTIGNSVKTIGVYAFYGCGKLTSFTIPNSVTTIGNHVFSSCKGLTSVTIGNSVTTIGAYAFNCDNLSTIVSLIEKPFEIIGLSSKYDKTFSQNAFMNGTLYVPTGTKDAYKATNGWRDFAFIEEGTPGSGGGEPATPETKKCEKPVISYQNGKLTFSSETEGATCISSITDADMGTFTTNEVQLSVTYNINVYAAKKGYENSETVTATLCWIDQEPKTEGITNGIANVPANAVMIRSEAGVLSVQGVDDGMQVSVYSMNGTQAGSAVSNNGQATVNTNLQPGSVAIVKIGEKSVKVVVK